MGNLILPFTSLGHARGFKKLEYLNMSKMDTAIIHIQKMEHVVSVMHLLEIKTAKNG